MVFEDWRKGRTKRTPEQQVELTCRILDGRHWEDVAARAKAELGARGLQLGPLDLSRNVLASFVDRLARAYITPPMVTGGLTGEQASWIGDHSASTTVKRYATAEGRPMPTAQASASAEALRYRLGAGYAGVLLDVSADNNRASLEVISPCDLKLEYGSDAPGEPVIIRHRRAHMIGAELKPCWDVYDLSDPEAPSYTILDGDDDVTAQVLGDRAGEWWWTDSEGAPFHRIVITGDNRHPFRLNTLVEATLSVCVAWTHWRAGVLDAGHPSRHAIGLRPMGHDADGEGQATGTLSGPEIVHVWEHVDPERPGSILQLGPGFDPEIVGRAIRNYEVSAMNASGLPLSLEATGGAPTQEERAAMEELVALTYPECRRFDGELLRRLCAMRNRLLSTKDPEQGFGLLYRDEVHEALEAVAPTTPTAKPAPPAKAAPTTPTDMEDSPDA